MSISGIFHLMFFDSGSSYLNRGEKKMGGGLLYMILFVKTHTHAYFILIVTLKKTKNWPPTVWPAPPAPLQMRAADAPCRRLGVSGLMQLRDLRGSEVQTEHFSLLSFTWWFQLLTKNNFFNTHIQTKECLPLFLSQLKYPLYSFARLQNKVPQPGGA